MKNAKYVEPVDFIPEELRKKYGVGEYNTDIEDSEKPKRKSKKDKEVKDAMGIEEEKG